MTYQVDEREARKAYVRRRQTIVFSISGAVLAVVLVIALLFNFHVFGLGEVELRPASRITATRRRARSRTAAAKRNTCPTLRSAFA